MTSLTSFDPNAASSADSGIFGLPYSEKESALVFLPVPWEATTSYGAGTSKGPAAILEASRQVDLFDIDVEKPYEAGMFLLPESRQVRTWNRKAKAEAAKVIRAGGVIGKNAKLRSALKTVNALSGMLNDYVFAETKRLLKSGKFVGVLGGDHSVPFGAIRAVAEKHPSFGILHLDAHSDTRRAFEGFAWSHASIMHNVLENIPQVKKLVQVGIRDFCEEEYDYTRAQGERVQVFYDRDLARKKFEGANWWDVSRDLIVSALPQEVWISFDIDGLDPKFCPHTGTPVPGGLDYQEALHLLWTVVHSGRKIIGFDLNEVSPDPSNSEDEWDANVGARLLYKLGALMLASQGKATLRR
ncbi:MAG: arginase [Bdellovibrionales bacterium GWB1_55_8]|nr:MAG: arginase [Bdellovibrionales bacterium GWB1_55_8]